MENPIKREEESLARKRIIKNILMESYKDVVSTGFMTEEKAKDYYDKLFNSLV